MNFKKLPKEKRNHLIMVALGTVAVLAGLAFGLIRYQYANLRKIDDNTKDAGEKLYKMQNSIKRANVVEADLVDARKTIAALENGMAPQENTLLWIINKVRSFGADYPKVDVPGFGQAALIEDMNLFPKFPYRQAVLGISGKAHYHDLGVFLSDFENKFPHVRLLNLDLRVNPEAGQGPGEKEKIAFTMDIVTLVKNP